MKTNPFNYILVLFFSCMLAMSACEEKIDLNLTPNKPLLVVEAYINNIQSQYNYVVLTRSQDYFSPNLNNVPVQNAAVFITEGMVTSSGGYAWDTSSRVQLTELNNPLVPPAFRQGVYFDPRIVSDPNAALRGMIGKAYLLEIEAEGQRYSAITSLPTPIEIDSLTFGFESVNDSNERRVRITNHYQDPDTLGNSQLYYWIENDDRNSFGWGGIDKSRFPGKDDQTNGQYIRLTHPNRFEVPDTIDYYMASVNKDVYNFWESYDEARNNGGPFSTPVQLKSNLRGAAVTGCFSGFSLSYRRVFSR